MNKFLKEFKDRGYFYQCTNEDELSSLLNKKKIKAHTLNQIKLVESFERNDMVFAVGPAGTGKTYTGIAIAVKAL